MIDLVVDILDRFVGRLIILRYGTGSDIEIMLKEYDIYPNERLGSIASLTVGSVGTFVINISLASAGFKGDAEKQVLYGTDTTLGKEVRLTFPR